MEAVNEASKNVARCLDLMKQYVDSMEVKASQEVLEAIEILEKTLEVLTKH